jgi:hypothetical protein
VLTGYLVVVRRLGLVWAKVEGRQLAGMDTETAALLFNEFEVLEIEEIPRGLRSTKLS